MIEPDCVCYHEAGHAVVADEYGLRVRGLRIDADGGGMDVDPDEEQKLLFEQRLAVCAGGAAAERLLNCPNERERSNCDWERFKGLLEKGGVSDNLEGRWEQAVERMKVFLTSRKSKVKRLASELQNRGPSLSEEQIAAVLRRRPKDDGT
jgi:hypothetical protein